MMTEINRTDLIHVTALSGGTTLLSTSFSGATSIGDVFRHVVSARTESAGRVVTLRIRNSSQGWVQQHTIVLKNRS